MKAIKNKKRTKYVYSSSAEVAHIWASQSQDSARQAGTGGGWHSSVGDYPNGRCFFEGASIYSYGRHYELGRLVRIKGKQVALINSAGGYGPTTGGHIGDARRATSHMLQIDVGHDFDWQQGLLNMQDRLVAEIFDTLNRRSFWSQYRVWESMEEYTLGGRIKAFNALATALGKKQLALYVPQDLIQLLQAHVDARIARDTELQRERNSPEYIAKKNAAATKKAEREIAAWMQGAPSTNAVRNLPVQLVRLDGEELVTTRSARVSVPLALRALRKLDKGILKRGEQVGPYSYTSCNGDILKVGCHTLSIAQIRDVLSKASTTPFLSIVKETA